MFKGTAKIHYDPHRPGMKRRTDWWAIAHVDREITRYYRWWVQRKYGLELNLPSWDAHISIVRGEKPRDDLMHLWKKYHGQTVNFTYDNFIKWAPDHKNGGHYFWVTVDAPELMAIRHELEMPATWKLHVTIGRTYK